MSRHRIPSTRFTCSGNVMWLYPWQRTPADALDPGSSAGLLSMHGWGLSFSLIGPVKSWHELQLKPAEDPAGCAPPSHHAHAWCIPHDWTRPPGPGDHVLVRQMSAMTLSMYWVHLLFFFTWKTDVISRHHISSGLSRLALFLIFPVRCPVACHTFVGGRRSNPSAETTFSVQRCQPSLLPSHLIPRCLSQPSSTDKKEPLLRCFARHYKTVAMDTQSEQAPHTSSRIGNDRGNVLHFKNSFFCL